MNNLSKTKSTTKYDSAIVKEIQKQLNLLGFGPLNVDGLFGNFTKHALKAYQSANIDIQNYQMTTYGKVDPLTWSSLFGPNHLVDISSSLLRGEAINIARNEIGVREEPPYSNSGPRVSSYLKSVDLNPGYAWCAAFVYWSFDQASIKLNRENPLLKTATCGDHWKKTKGLKIESREAILNPWLIEPGDIFIIINKNGTGHTGIVRSVRKGLMQTIEGNTNSSHSNEGIGVLELMRRIETVNCGFIRYC